MSAYLIGQIKVKDDVLWQEYVAGVQDSLVPFEASTLFRGRKLQVLAGQNDKDRVVVIEFSDQLTMEKWFDSEKYQSLISLRDKAASVIITTYEA